MSLVGAITAFGICSNAHKWCLPLPLENCGGVLHLLNGTGFMIAFIWPAFINYKLLSPLIGVVASRIHGVILFVWRLVWPKESALKPSMRDVMQPGGMMSMTWHRKEWKYVTSSSPFISQWRWGERRSQLMWRNHEKKNSWWNLEEFLHLIWPGFPCDIVNVFHFTPPYLCVSNDCCSQRIQAL